MKKGIVLKLFLLTTALCSLILAMIFIGQLLFFKVFYAEKKTESLKFTMENFQKSYLKKSRDVDAVIDLKDDYLTNHNTWIAVVNDRGYIIGEHPFNLIIDFNYTPRGESGKVEPRFLTIRNSPFSVPLYNLVNINDIWENKIFFHEEMPLRVIGLLDNQYIIPV
ncbi:hypothetical protein J9303_15090, partial [Bacillaceae bacterium Marseille-Q3522]|nr:hypothetical protein [Bacillaceae bacterium Marseille-Q3522]